MRRTIRFLQLGALVIGVLAGFADISLAANAKDQPSPTAITDIKSIAGKWEGIMVRTPRSRTDDWVRVNIQDTGDYDSASYRTIGVFSGKGKLTVADGKATAQSEKGRLTLQLFTDKTSGQPMLKAEGRGKDRIAYRAELKKTSDAAPGGQK